MSRRAFHTMLEPGRPTGIDPAPRDWYWAIFDIVTLQDDRYYQLYADLLWMRFQHAMSYRDIGCRYGVSSTTVGRALNDAEQWAARSLICHHHGWPPQAHAAFPDALRVALVAKYPALLERLE